MIPLLFWLESRREMMRAGEEELVIWLDGWMAG